MIHVNMMAGLIGGPAPVISAILATPAGSDVTVTWTTDITSDSVVEYGSTVSYGTSTGLLLDNTTSHSVTIFALSNNRYHFRVSSRAHGGPTTYSTDGTFTVGPVASIGLEGSVFALLSETGATMIMENGVATDISAMTQMTALTGAEILLGVQGGVTSNITLNQFKTYVTT